MKYFRYQRSGMVEHQFGEFVNTRDAEQEIATRDARIAELEADRRVLQSTGEHPAPCACHCEANAFRIELRNKDARIEALQASVSYEQRHAAESETALAAEHAALLEAKTRIAELEKQAAIDKTLLALADARINRDLRDDFAGRAMQGALSSGSFSMLGHPERAKFAYTQADEMLKAKGGA